jgi:hypothetical protein
VTLFGNKEFAELISKVRMKSHCVKIGSNLMITVFIIKGNRDTKVYTMRTSCENGSRDWSDVSTSQGMGKTVSTPGAKRETRKLLPSRECGPVDALVLDLWPPELWKSNLLLLF